jgi:glutathione S-transferase
LRAPGDIDDAKSSPASSTHQKNKTTTDLPTIERHRHLFDFITLQNYSINKTDIEHTAYCT